MRLRFFLMACTCLLIMTAYASSADTSAPITTQVQVKGLVKHPFACTLKNVHLLKPETHTNLNIVGAKGEIKKVFRSFKGVSLKNILDSAGVDMPNPKEKGKYYITIKASDGYTVLYSWNDIYNNPTGDHVFLVFSVNDQPVQKDGQFVMVCTNDKITGPRHVKWVESIEVAKLP
ncbi:molybdopterin-dependent oxidoreductase [Chitinophaga defluvii]|uniref:Molybdopterin-dependent oxidoreductase n=1 Tax=Chitinophaga defluvii TaxID=3163343 RepID=A0ABV2TAP3_9BACT